MATQVGDRIEVGTCDMGNVFIFHRAERDGRTDAQVNDTWTVRAGNHTVGTYSTEADAEALARALVGDNIDNTFVAENPTPAVQEYVEAVQKKVSKK